ncbi:MAG: FAD-dependent monooxygenase [Sciscionella sp.]
MRVVICGAGIAGLALAQRMTTLGADVVLVEKAPGPRDQGYMIDFFGPGYDAAEAMGLLPRLVALGYPVDEVNYLDESGRRRSRLSYHKVARAVGGRLLSIMRPDLELALREQVAGKADLRFGSGIKCIENLANGVAVTLSDNTVLDADLLVGADGIHSTVRRLVFGPERDYLRYLGFHTAAYIFHDAEIHRQLRNRFCLTDSVGREMGFYGLRDGRVAVFAVHRAVDPTVPEDTARAVREAYSTLGWIVPRSLAGCPDTSEVYYDQVAQIEIPQWHRERVVLLGDACQAVSLLAGQGASLAIAGAYVLAAKLATEGSIEAALTGYQTLWRPTVEDKQRVARSGAQWFLPLSRRRLWSRRVALKLMQVPGLGRFLGTALIGKSNATIENLSHDSREPSWRAPQW